MIRSHAILSGVALVADGDPDRGKSMAEACATRGLVTRHAAHGAEALEVALADPPDVVVVAFDLPLIAAPQLAGILRANPRTQRARFVVIGGAPGCTFGPAPIDAVIAAPVDPEMVLRRVASLLARTRGVRPAASSEAATSDLEGSLAQLTLADLLQLFHMNRKTGRIDLTRRAADGVAEQGSVAITDGNVVDARCGAAGAEKALLRLLAWRSGSFCFRRARPAGPARIHTPTRALLLEGMRQVDEMARLRTELPSLDAQLLVLHRPDSAALPAPPLTREVLALVRNGVRVGDLLDRSPHPDYQVLRALHALVERGALALRVPRATAPAAQSGTLLSEAQLGRLRAWVQRRRLAGPACEARILLASSDIETTRGFVSLLAAHSDVSLDRALRGGRFSGSMLRAVARLGPTSEIGIEVVHLPSHASFAPLWTLAASSALGLILVSGAASGDRVRAVQAVERTVAGSTGLRSCWALLEQRPVPRPGRAIAAALGLRPETPLVRITAGTGARSELARLFASLVP